MPDSDTSKYSADDARWSTLMASAQSGVESDYRILLAELSQVVHRYLQTRLGGYDFVEDCVQEVLIAVHEARHSYNPGRAFRPWLFAIVRHKAIDAMRRGETRGRLQLVGDAMPESAVAGPDSDLDSGQLIAGLPQGLREALTLTKIYGLSSAEAAGRLGISQAAVKVRVHRAMRQLKNLLEKDIE